MCWICFVATPYKRSTRVLTYLHKYYIISCLSISPFGFQSAHIVESWSCLWFDCTICYFGHVSNYSNRIMRRTNHTLTSLSILYLPRCCWQRGFSLNICGWRFEALNITLHDWYCTTPVIWAGHFKTGICHYNAWYRGTDCFRQPFSTMLRWRGWGWRRR